jgi:Ni,Fe-hydrogenase maturation factor
MKTVIVFGNPDLPMDSLPQRILPELKKRVPDTEFLLLDPNEEWPNIDDFTVIDTVQGIDKVTVFSELNQFASAPRLTMHDFDALSYLRYLEKLGKVKKVTIIGVPMGIDEAKAVEEVTAMLRPS